MTLPQRETPMTVTTSRLDMLEWKALEDHQKSVRDTRMIDLFDQDPQRFDKFHITHDGLLLDYSKTLTTKETMLRLFSLARGCGLEEWRDMMFAGGHINNTEDRPALHAALRMEKDQSLSVDGQDIIPEIHAVLARMKDLSNRIRAEKRFTHIVNLGIGGSDLGPYMVCEALKPFSERSINMYFVSNVDSSHLAEVFQVVDPAKTLFLVTSKSFTTQETMTNARSAQSWLREKLGVEDVSEHFIAITANTDEAKSFGMEEDSIYPMWDWVGGRYSTWSAIGLPICLSIGFDNFEAMLRGARAMDKHFIEAPLEHNMPVILGLLGVWHRNFFDYPAVTVAPYDQYLHSFTSYLQQLDMESNGKRVDRNGDVLAYETGPIIFGKPGTNGQHAFFQQIHQGTTIVPVEFIAALKSQNPIGDHHKILMSNVIGQSKALMDGLAPEDPHKVFTGNRPSMTLLMDELDPYHLGMLMALYEHKVFVQGVIWNINSFDQWGVQLGKILANRVLDIFSASESALYKILDSSTASLIDCVKKSSVGGTE